MCDSITLIFTWSWWILLLLCLSKTSMYMTTLYTSISDFSYRPRIDSFVCLLQVIIWNCNCLYRRIKCPLLSKVLQCWFVADTYNHRKLMRVHCKVYISGDELQRAGSCLLFRLCWNIICVGTGKRSTFISDLERMKA